MSPFFYWILFISSALKYNYDVLTALNGHDATSQKQELEATLAQVKRLEGIIPICTFCKKTRDDQSCWHQLEQYIIDHSEAHFSHGICPHCAEEHEKSVLSKRS